MLKLQPQKTEAATGLFLSNRHHRRTTKSAEPIIFDSHSPITLPDRPAKKKVVVAGRDAVYKNLVNTTPPRKPRKYNTLIS